MKFNTKRTMLVGLAGGTVVGKMAVLAEGGAKDRDDILFLEPLPLCWEGLSSLWFNSWASSLQLAKETEGAGTAQG